MPKDTFEWNDELVIEYLGMVTPADDENYWRHELNRFKQSKIKEPERIEVTKIVSSRGTDYDSYEPVIYFYFNKWPSRDSYEAIKKSIEKILNNEPSSPEPDRFPGLTKLFKEAERIASIEKKSTAQPLSGEMITLEECERREMNAWAAALARVPYEGTVFTKSKYPSYKDYQQSINQ